MTLKQPAPASEPGTPDAAYLSDEAVVALVLKETTPEDYKRYAPSVLALWRPRLDAAADLAYRVRCKQVVADTEARCAERLQASKAMSMAALKEVGDMNLTHVAVMGEMASDFAATQALLADERAAAGALVAAVTSFLYDDSDEMLDEMELRAALATWNEAHSAGEQQSCGEGREG